MPEKKLTLKRAQKLAKRAVERRGADYVYEPDNEGACHYFRGGAPSCIVGHVIWDLGFTAEQVKEGDSASEVLRALGVEFDSQTEDFLRSVQALQDVKHPWGYAVERATETILKG